MNASKRKTWNVEEKDSFYEFSGVVHLFPISLWHLQPKSFCYYVCDTMWYLMWKTKLEDEGNKGFYLALILFPGFLKRTERENTLEESWTGKQKIQRSRLSHFGAWMALKTWFPSVSNEELCQNQSSLQLAVVLMETFWLNQYTLYILLVWTYQLNYLF